MLEINEPLRELKKQLVEHHALQNIGLVITANEQINTNENLTPWLGIYTKEVKHDPLTLATNSRRWKGFISLVLVIQATSLQSGEACGELLEEYIKEVVEAVITDTSFGNTIDMVKDLTVTYSYDNKKGSTLHFQTAFIDLQVESEHEKS